MTEPRTLTLTSLPSLLPLMARGALLSPFKRPRPGLTAPGTRLVLPGLRIAQSHLAAYERVCAFPTGRAELPITYPHILGFPLAMRLMSERAFPLPLLGLVHTSIDITQERDLAPGDTYELAVRVEELRAHRRGTEAVVSTGLRTGGVLVWQSTSTYLARHKTAGVAESVPAATESGAPLPPLADWTLRGDLGRRYAAASGDRNPIHLHPLTARLFGFPRAIAHGMWTVARCLAHHGASGPVHVHARFKAPVLLPGTVTYAAQGSSFELRNPKGDRVHVTGEVRKPGGGNQDVAEVRELGRD
ncbi:MaoC/PaaZ C-terminal domain-containing protein [Streptomyces kunmingensis]|uniref:MaoC/PaaZ C-terminal domain-containing protein n=1 Tax=Streptomyces kunmingensis TaxID=68225 RepID=A0ABU6CQ04_9ACTN|nr:MaoC/PaaZ C-terminal domain-containing protein [Streptomyces kunmingensis]MEB3966723.1 MaoC/PaaZ C-terminal domain-containing protein [Streptomyces kunmingensis]